MTQRFRSGKYSLRQIDEPENNQREQVIEQALQLIQMSDELDLMDHYSLLLASQVSEERTARNSCLQLRRAFADRELPEMTGNLSTREKEKFGWLVPVRE